MEQQWQFKFPRYIPFFEIIIYIEIYRQSNSVYRSVSF